LSGSSKAHQKPPATKKERIKYEIKSLWVKKQRLKEEKVRRTAKRAAEDKKKKRTDLVLRVPPTENDTRPGACDSTPDLRRYATKIPVPKREGTD